MRLEHNGTNKIYPFFRFYSGRNGQESSLTLNDNVCVIYTGKRTLEIKKRNHKIRSYFRVCFPNDIWATKALLQIPK